MKIKNMSQIDLTSEEKIIQEALLDARKVQEFLWGNLSQSTTDKKQWIFMFEKRISKLKEIDFDHVNARVELRKRVLQQAALSIKLLQILQEEEELDNA